MSSKSDRLSPCQPALVQMFGTGNEPPHWLLNRDAILVGRARGCDIGLEAPDISSIHFVITRSSGEYRARDCGSRAGTKLNGQPLRESPLMDGDILQLGPFSFRVQLPAGAASLPIANEANLRRLERSRRQLAERALKLRKKLQHPAEGEALRRQASDLHHKVKDYVLRFTKLETAERELAQDREKFIQERAAFQAHADQREAELERRGRELEARARELAERATAQRANPENPERKKSLEEQAFRLQRRQEELELYARRLSEHEQELTRQQQQLTQGFEEMSREQQEFTRKQSEWAEEFAAARQLLDEQRDAFARAEDGLREQRREMAQMLADLQQIQDFLRAQQNPELLNLAKENEQLRQIATELEQELIQAKAQLKETPPPAAAPAVDPIFLEEIRGLHAENQELRECLRKADEDLRQLKEEAQAAPVTPRSDGDLETYESELNRFRQQLEQERAKLHAEIQALKARNAELDEATREMEMEFSRERAELARERMRLDRMREEAKAEVERYQRDAGMRESLAPVQRLRDEMARRQPTGK